jgi:deferrochelatase/peroxidase EfeB
LTRRGANATDDVTGRASSDSLTEPLALRGRRPGDVPLLTALQPNILRPHVRDSLRVFLLRIDDATAARASLARIARDRRLMKSAAYHFDELANHRAHNAEGTAFVEIALSNSGYERLEVPNDRRPPDTAFRAGMSARRDLLADPDPRGWDYTHPIHGLLLVGSQSAAVTDERVRLVHGELKGMATVGEETGETLYNHEHVPMEHFGYVDGRSQPLFVTEDAERERDTTDGISVWDPLVPLDRVLVPDPGATESGHSFGSYLIYRKLEQNVKTFDAKEDLVAQLLALSKSDEERAGAMLVGRFEDGTPVAIQSAGRGSMPIANNFTYADDAQGTKCPHFAHIRVMNDRKGASGERIVIARRGQTYGARPDIDDPEAAAPSGGVGLLFMAAVSDIESQFERLQQAANGAGAWPRDPVIGQGTAGAAAMEFPRVWGGSDMTPCPDALTPVVTMRGGEYFFVPSLTFLRHLDGGA